MCDKNKYDKDVVIKDIIEELKKVDLVFDLLLIKNFIKNINNKSNKK